jgi:Protein of unknown function (DUF1579)
MNRTTLFAFTAGSLVTAGAALLIAAGPEHKHHDDDHKMHEMKEMDSMDPMDEMDHMAEMSAEEMMAGMMKLSTPNEHHAELMTTVGSWSAKTSFVMDPAAPPTEGPATMTVKEMLDGRYVMSHFKMDFMGQPFEGYSIMGYDNAHEEYISIWMDSMSTKITYMTGNKDEDGNMVMLGTSTTPMGDNPMKIVTTKHDNDHWTDKFYDMMPDGTWFNSGTIKYTRD